MILINKPKFDKRKFVGGKLDNGIKYIIINDEHLEKSYVTVSLNVGSFANPKEYNGLAHFLEHMLFMGSKKYPNENHYHTRLNELGGSSNAYTDTTETVYYFNVFDDGLLEIFDIFSRFFIDPLFDPDSISRELNAVDSEHKKNVNNDYWKKYQLMLYLTNLDSETNTFITGSLNTLNKPDIRDQVIEFYKKYYTPENISICIASSKPIETINKIITDTFGIIESRDNQEKPTITKPFYSENKLKTFHLKTISNIYELTFIWEIPHQSKHNYLQSKDFTIFELLLTNKSDKSLFFHLKNLGFIVSINTEIQYEGAFSVCFKLTKEGFNNLEYIQSALYHYIDLIYDLDSSLKSYAKYFEKVMEINFDCLSKFDTEELCNLLSVNHHYHDTINVFDGSFKIQNIKSSNEYKKVLNKYINSSNAITIISSPNYVLPDLSELSDQEFKLNYIKMNEYDATYSLVPSIKNIKLDSSSQAQMAIFDLKNEYLDAEPIIIPELDKYQIPTLITDRQWYGGCSKFCEPLVKLWMQLNSNEYFKNPQNYILTNISCSILNFMISVDLYKPLELCYSISFEPKPSLSSVSINIRGLNDVKKIRLLVNELADFLLNIDELFAKLSDNYVNNLIVSFKDAILNTNYLNPWEYFTYILKTKFFNTEFSTSELMEQFDSINPKMIKTFLKKLLNNASLTTLIYGNILSDNLDTMFSKFNKLFENSNHQLPIINNPKDFVIDHPNPNEKSHCITYYYPVGKFIPKDFILLNLTTNMLSQSFFDNLRTKHQLGYMVSMGFKNVRDEYYLIQKIQSDKPIEFIKEKMDDFNKNLIKIIEQLDFDNFITTIRNQLMEPDYSMDEKIARYLPEISLRQYLFNRNEILLEQLNKVTINDIIDFIKLYMNNKNKKIFIINAS